MRNRAKDENPRKLGREGAESLFVSETDFAALQRDYDSN